MLPHPTCAVVNWQKKISFLLVAVFISSGVSVKKQEMHYDILFCPKQLPFFWRYCFRKLMSCIGYTLQMKTNIYQTNQWIMSRECNLVQKQTDCNALVFKQLYLEKRSFNFCTCFLSVWFAEMLWCFQNFSSIFALKNSHSLSICGVCASNSVLLDF